MLTGDAIRKRLGNDIIINPFNKDNLNPNSYDLTLHDIMATYDNTVIDIKEEQPITTFRIDKESPTILYPFNLYLASTIEYTETYNLIPLIDGVSSLARCGLSVHKTAGFGDIGFNGYWTLEITVVKPLKIYAGIPICQISYRKPVGDIITTYEGKYQNNKGLQASKSYAAFR